MPSSGLPTEYTARQNLFEQLVRGYDAKGLTLPDLAPRESWLEAGLRRLREWAESLLPDVHLGPSLKSWLKAALHALPYLIMAILVLAIGIAIYAAVRRALRRVEEAEPEAPRSSPGLEPKLEAALARGDFALAARLRWKLFLARRREPADRTPQEYLEGRGAFVLSQYRLMFGRAETPEPVYGELHGALSALEAEPAATPPAGRTS